MSKVKNISFSYRKDKLEGCEPMDINKFQKVQFTNIKLMSLDFTHISSLESLLRLEMPLIKEISWLAPLWSIINDNNGISQIAIE